MDRFSEISSEVLEGLGFGSLEFPLGVHALIK